MKVLYVIPGLGVGGGAERSLLDMAPGLRSAGIDLAIAYFHERPSSAVEAFAAAGVPVQHLVAPTFVAKVRQVRAQIARFRPDVVHTTLFEADIVGRLASVGMPVRVMTSLVSTPYEPARRRDPRYVRWRVAAVRAVEAVTLRLFCDHVHANSEAVRDAAVRSLGVRPDQVTVVRRGRSSAEHPRTTPDARRAARRALDLDDQRPIVVAVGRHEYQKDPVSLVEAMAQVVRNHPQALLLLAGRRGELSDQLGGAIARHGLAEHVQLLGHRDDIGTLLTAADVLAFSSVSEGLPGTVIEAMAIGVPIVATDIPAVRELVDDRSALLVPPADPVSMAAAIGAVLDDPAGAGARAAAARAAFEAGFQVERALDEMVELYRAVGAG